MFKRGVCRSLTEAALDDLDSSDPCDIGQATITNSFDSTVSAELYPTTIGNWNDGYLAGAMYSASRASGSMLVTPLGP